MRHLILILFLCPVLVFSREYKIRDDQVECTLNTLPQSYMFELLGDLGPMWLSVEAGRKEFAWSYVDFCANATREYMAVRVTIKNNFPDKIYLAKDKYLAVPPDFFVSKEKIAEIYDPYIKEYEELVLLWKLCTVTTLIPTLGAAGLAIFGKDKLLRCLGVAGTVLCGVPSTLFMLANNKKGSLYDKIKTAKKNVLSSVSHDPLDKPEMFKWKMYEIAPGEVFEDVLFVNLARYKRSVFSTFVPELIMYLVINKD